MSNTNSSNGFSIKSHYLPLYLPHLLVAIYMFVVVPTLPLIALELNLSEFLVGLTIAMRHIGIAVGDIPASLLIARIGFRNSTWLAIALMVSSALAPIFFENYAVLLTTRLTEGFGISLWLVSRQTYLATVSPNRVHGRAGALLGGGIRLGAVIGPIVGGSIAQGLTIFELDMLRNPFVVQVAAVSLLAVVLFLTMPKKLELEHISIREMPKAMKHVVRENYSVFLKFGVISLIMLSLRSAREILVPLQAVAVGIEDSFIIGLILGVSSALDFVLFPLAGIIMDRYGRKFSGVPSLLFMSGGIVLVGYSSLAGGAGVLILWLGALSIGVANGVSSGLVIALGTDLAPRKYTSEFIGIWRMMSDSGGALGLPIIGAISTLSSIPVASLFIAGAGVLGALGYALFTKETLVKSDAKNDP